MSEVLTENNVAPMSFIPEMSTDSICYKDQTTVCLSDVLDEMQTGINGKLSESDAVDAFAPISHTHSGYAASSHTHSDLVSAIEALDDTKAASTHTHAQDDVTGLVDKLAEIDEAIAALQSSGSAEVAPLLTLSMHLGKLDNNNGSELAASTRICSDPFAVENGKSYWQVNDKAVNMYALLYDADEVFLGYLGNFASGAEIAVNNASAAYMRLSSLVGEYDLTNNFYIYDADPSSGSTEEEAFTQAAADLLYAPISHTHDGYAAADHTHTAEDITGLPSSVDAYSKTEADAMFATADHTHTGFAAAEHTHTADDITGLPASVDAYSKTEVDNMLTGKADATHTHTEYASANDLSGKADASHTHSYSDVGAAAASHTHTASEVGAAASYHTHDYAASNHTHSGYASTSHGHANYASSTHTHTASAVGALPSSGGTVSGDLTVTGTGIFNGALNTQKIQPKDSGSYSIGTADNRYYSTYLRVNPNVSSDRRCKRDIAPMDIEALAAFVGKLSVVNYNYNDDAADEAKRIGLIAQDVVAADPTIAKGCIEQDEKGFYSLRAADLVYPLIAAVQTLSKRIEELERK